MTKPDFLLHFEALPGQFHKIYSASFNEAGTRFRISGHNFIAMHVSSVTDVKVTDKEVIFLLGYTEIRCSLIEECFTVYIF